MIELLNKDTLAIEESQSLSERSREIDALHSRLKETINSGGSPYDALSIHFCQEAMAYYEAIRPRRKI